MKHRRTKVCYLHNIMEVRQGECQKHTHKYYKNGECHYSMRKVYLILLEYTSWCDREEL